MNYDDGLQGNEDRRRSDEDGRHAGKGVNLFWDIQVCWQHPFATGYSPGV